VAGSVNDDKVESSEEQSPSGLTWIQTLSISQVLQVSMVGDDLKTMVCSLRPMSPLLKGKLELSIADIVVLFHRGQLFGVEGT